MGPPKVIEIIHEGTNNNGLRQLIFIPVRSATLAHTEARIEARRGLLIGAREVKLPAQEIE